MRFLLRAGVWVSCFTNREAERRRKEGREGGREGGRKGGMEGWREGGIERERGVKESVGGVVCLDRLRLPLLLEGEGMGVWGFEGRGGRLRFKGCKVYGV